MSTAAASRIDGTRKAAILMILLGEEAASSICRNLSSKEVQRVAREIADLETIPPQDMQEVLQEYQKLVSTQDYSSRGGTEYAADIVIKAFGEKTAKELLIDTLREREKSSNKMEFLKKVDAQQLAKFIESEHPQTIALVLAHLDSKQASAVLMKLPDQVRADAIKRLAQLRQFSPEMAEKVSLVLQRKMQSLGEQSRRSYAGSKGVADLMNRIEPATAKVILETIEQEEPQLAINIRDLMFTFEDLLSVPEAAIRELLSQIDKKTLATALKGASEDLKSHVFHTMSSRAVEMLKEDMDAMGAVRGKEITKAQQEAVAVARKLESEGKLVLKNEGDEEYVV